MARLLVLSAGRRRYVLEELLRTKPEGATLWASDATPFSAGLSVPGIRSIRQPVGDLKEWLLAFCQDHAISAILSLHDYQSVEVSAIREELASVGTLWIGPSSEVASMLLDKHALAVHLSNFEGLAIPTYLPGADLPDHDTWVVKDRWGSGSSGLLTNLSKTDSLRELAAGDKVAQPQQQGDEWNIDFFILPDGSINGYSAKRKLRMRAGETDAAEVLIAAAVPFDVERVLDAFRGLDHLGNVDVDVFVEAGQAQVVDANPRFGGGYAFSLHAGYSAAEAVWSLTARSSPRVPIHAVKTFRGAKSLEVVEV